MPAHAIVWAEFESGSRKTKTKNNEPLIETVNYSFIMNPLSRFLFYSFPQILLFSFLKCISSQTNLIQNPGAELSSSPAVSPGWSSSNSYQTGWASESCCGGPSGYSGSFLTVCTSSCSTLSQSIPTLTLGSVYLISFWIATDSITSSCSVTMGSNSIFNLVSMSPSYSLYSTSFTAASSSMLLSFSCTISSGAIRLTGISIVLTSPSSQPTGQPSRQPTSFPTYHPRSFDNVFMQLVAGASTNGYNGDNGPATSAKLISMIPWVDISGNIYLPSHDNSVIRKITRASGIITTIGGTGSPATTGTSGAVGSVSFLRPFAIVGDVAGTYLYISDQWYVWKYIFSTGMVSVYAGKTAQGYSGDDGPVSSAQVNIPEGLWLTTSNILYIADRANNRVRKVTASGIITTVAGCGDPATFGGDSGSANLARLNGPQGVYLDSVGKLFIADTSNNRIRLVDTHNIITTFAGTGNGAFNGNYISATSANINGPWDVKGDSLGNIYIADWGNVLIRIVDKNGIISTLFGNGNGGFTSGISARTEAFDSPVGIWVDSSSTIYFSDYKTIHRSILMSPTSHPSSQPTVQPSRQPSSQPSEQPSSQPSFQPISSPSTQPTRVPTRQPTNQPSSRPSQQPTSSPSYSFEKVFMKLIAGTSTSGNSGDSGPATSGQVSVTIPWVDSSGNLYLPHNQHYLIRRIDSNGIISTFGGTGSSSTIGTGGSITSVNFNHPLSLVGDTGNTFLYICDERYIWKYIFSTGITTVFAHSTSLGSGFSGDNGPATAAQLQSPQWLWLTTSDVLFVADIYNNRIRKIVGSIISTAAGSTGAGGFAGDNGPAVTAKLNNPRGVYVDTNGNLFIADSGNNRIRLVDTNNFITTFAGSGSDSPFNGENIPASQANLNYPYDVKGDTLGKIYIADYFNCIIRMVGSAKLILTLFGIPGTCGFTAGISSRTSSMMRPTGIWLDSLSNLYFSDYNSIHRRVIVTSPSSQPSGQPTRQPTSLPSSQPGIKPTMQPSSQPTTQPTCRPSSQPSQHPTAVSTSQMPSVPKDFVLEPFAGTGVSGDGFINGYGREATNTKLNTPYKLWGDTNGNVYFADNENRHFRVVNTTNIVSSIAYTSNIYYPYAICGDTAGSLLYMVDDRYVWKYSLSAKTANILAGGSTPGYSGDGGPATSALISGPQSCCVNTGGLLYFTDSNGNRVRTIDANGIIRLFAGTGAATPFNDNIDATSANLDYPVGIWVDTNEVVYLAVISSNRIRRINSDSSHTISNFAGNGNAGYSGDNVPATSTSLNTPLDVKGDTLGNIFIADTGNFRIRMVTNGIITTIIGNGIEGTSRLVQTALHSISSVAGLFVDSKSNIYFSEYTQHQVRLASRATNSFAHTGNVQSVKVPSWATVMYVDISGAAGSNTAYAGNGARVQTFLMVSPGSTIFVYVGGMGFPSAVGGWNGGGAGGAGGYTGGGATDIRIGGSQLTDRKVVAGGGGGACGSLRGGDAGEVGMDGVTWCCSYNGKGASSSAGGAGGAVETSNPGQNGMLGVGGHTGDSGGGGGGGGYYGGKKISIPFSCQGF
jgi:sugar lactone lactonase YvrE/outer membrane biosynthesis protein TonB